jgi:hypothetical protein
MFDLKENKLFPRTLLKTEREVSDILNNNLEHFEAYNHLPPIWESCKKTENF